MARERRLVASLAATTTIGYGVLFYSYGVLLLPMERDLGWRRSVLSGAVSAGLLVAAVLTVPVGRWLDRHEPRTLLVGGGIAGAALTALWASVTSPVALYAVWIGLGACMATLFYEPAFTILTKRLAGADRHRAVTSVTLVAGLASTIFSPLTALLEDALGWRGAVLVLAALLATTVPLFSWSLRPSDADLVPHGHADTVPRDALRSLRFWCLTAAYTLTAITSYAMAVHLVPYLVEEGWRPGHAAIALGCVGLLQVLGRTTFARLATRWAAGPLGTWVLGVKAIGIAAVVVSPTLAGVAVFLAVYGAANGLQTLTRATVVADLYGVAHYGSISAVVSAVSAVAGSLSPFAVAAAIELVGDDEPVLWGLALVALAAAVANEVAVGTRPRGRGAVVVGSTFRP